jgi:hypothetical protein
MNRHFNAATALSTLVFCLAIGSPGSSNAGIPETTDGDQIPDVLDKCMLDSRNATPGADCDSDSDGYGNVCDADFNQNGVVNPIDFTDYFIPAFKGLDPSPWPQGMDMNCNGVVNPIDFTDFFLPKFKGALGGSVPGPSGLSCAGQPGCQ